MPLAVTHVLLTIIIVDLYRDYVTKHKKYFTLHTIFIAGVAGLLPDIDIPLNWVLNLFGINLIHGTLTHTPFFALIFLIPGIFLWFNKNHKTAVYFFVICFGIFFHLFLDYLLGGGNFEGILLFYPFSSVAFKLHLLLNLNIPNIPAAVDAVILLIWLWHEEVKHKIIDFI